MDRTSLLRIGMLSANRYITPCEKVKHLETQPRLLQ